MKKGISIIFSVMFSLLLLTQCDLILGSGGNTNVSIDLGELFGSGRAAISPSNVNVTGIEITVFGPGMQTMIKTVTPGARYVNLYVPAGEDRHFRIEIIFNVIDPFQPPYGHVRSAIGTASADLRPGKFVGLRFTMVAGATKLQVPDFQSQLIFEATDMSFSPYQSGAFKFPLHPADLDIASDGRIVTANYFDDTRGIMFGTNLDGAGQGYVAGQNLIYSIAMDRNAGFEMDAVSGVDTTILYSAKRTTTNNLYYTVLDGVGPFTFTRLEFSGVEITGMDVDPWTHRLYIVGKNAGGNYMLIEYDPTTVKPKGTVVRSIDSNIVNVIRELDDVIVKYDSIFVLNSVGTGDLTLPIILKFDKNLNYLQGYGTISSNGETIIASTAAGKFYHPKRFFAHENAGLYIIDEYSTLDRIVHIDTTLNPASWQIFPATLGGAEPFSFFE